MQKKPSNDEFISIDDPVELPEKTQADSVIKSPVDVINPRTQEVSKKVFVIRGLGCFGLLIVVILGAWWLFYGQPKAPPEIDLQASLEYIKELSNLETVEAYYNGVARVKNKNFPDKIDYYVSYEATVKAGIDFSKIEFIVQEEEKKIIVRVPKPVLYEPNVKIESLDYIFVNKWANTPTVSSVAYPQCIEDVKSKTRTEKTILDLAEENSKNAITSLLEPFQGEGGYELVIE